MERVRDIIKPSVYGIISTYDSNAIEGKIYMYKIYAQYKAMLRFLLILKLIKMKDIVTVTS